MPPTGELYQVVHREALAAALKAQVHAARDVLHLLRCHLLPRGRGNVEHARLAVAWLPVQRHAGLAGQAELHHQLGQAAGMHTASPVCLEKVLARPGTPANRHPRAVGVHHQFFTRQPVVSLRAADFKGAGAVHAQLLGQRRRQPRQGLCQHPQLFGQCQPHRPVQSHRIGLVLLLQRAAEGGQAPCLPLLTHQHQHLAIGPKCQFGLLKPECCQAPGQPGHQPLLHRQVVGWHQAVGITDANRLVIRNLPEFGLTILQRPQAQVRLDDQRLRTGVPLDIARLGLAVAGRAVDLLHDLGDLNLLG